MYEKTKALLSIRLSVTGMSQDCIFKNCVEEELKKKLTSNVHCLAGFTRPMKHYNIIHQGLYFLC